MVPVQVARELRRQDVDVDAVVEHASLRGLPDEHQLAQAAAEGRAFVTYDAGDLLVLAAQRNASGQGHAGLVLLRSARFPQGDPDRLVTSLRRFVKSSLRPPGPGFTLWLE